MIKKRGAVAIPIPVEVLVCACFNRCTSLERVELLAYSKLVRLEDDGFSVSSMQCIVIQRGVTSMSGTTFQERDVTHFSIAAGNRSLSVHG